MRLSRRHAPFAYGVIQAAITTGVATAIATGLGSGAITAGAVGAWAQSWLIAWLTMLPVVIGLAPLIQRMVYAMTREDEDPRAGASAVTEAAGPPPVSADALIRGTVWALAAGLMWGLAFWAPLVLADYGPLEITAGRYAAYGLLSVVALAVAWLRGPVPGLRERAVWSKALVLTLVGNLLYFALLVVGVQHAGAPMAALIVGTLPVLLPLAASFGDRSVPIGRLAVPAMMMLLGLVSVHSGESAAATVAGGRAYGLGIAAIVAALLSWTWYGVANARAVSARPDISAATWASLQGVTLLPAAIVMLGIAAAGGALSAPGRSGLGLFIAVCVALGVATSWVAMWCWNRASQLLPAHIAGQLIVFETLAGLGYAYGFKGAWPPLQVSIGALLLLGGVVLGIRRLAQRGRAH